MLFRSTAEIKNYLPIDAVTRFESFTPFIQDAEALFLMPLIGQAMYDILHADYTENDGVPAVDANADLLPYVQRSLAFYMAFLSVDQLSVNFGDSGITQTRSDNVEPAPRHKTDSLKLNYITMADLHAERLLAYLELTATDSVLNDWYDSSANTIADGRILRTARQASEFIDIDQNRRIFRRMKRRIKEVEEGLISQLIGASQYQEIVTQIKNDTLKGSTANLLLVEKLEPIIAKKALLETLPSIKVHLIQDGLTIFSSSDGVVQKSAATVEQVRSMVLQLSESDTGYKRDIEKLKQFMIDFIDNYPLIQQSTAYTDRPDPGPKRSPNINPDQKFVSV